MGRRPNIEQRENILKQARELFHCKGFQCVSMDQIALKVGIKKANLFHYFKTKNELGFAVLEQATILFRETVTKRFVDGADPIVAVEGMFDDYRDCMKESKCARGCFMGNLALELSDHSEEWRNRLSDAFTYWTKRLENFLSKAKEVGDFDKDFNPREASEALVSLLEGALMMCKTRRDVGPLRTSRAMARRYLESSRVKAPVGS